MTQITSIITHAGQWHADEVSAIAIFFILKGKIEVKRKFNISQEELDSPSIMVLDIGKQYDLEKANLDHHQDGKLGASNLMMLNWLAMMGEDYRVLTGLKKNLFNRVSDIDRGVIPGGGESYEFNSIIRACDSFEQALELAIGIISRMIRDIEREIVDRELFFALPVIGKVAINKDSNILIGWKEAAEEKGLNYLVTPNPRGGFNIISRDSEKFPIGKDSGQTFRHESGFMAVYLTQEEAINAGI